MGMLLQNEFEVDADVEQAWAFFTDLAKVMPCLPGATLEGVEGDDYLGNVKIKVGPIGAHFRGTAHFVSKDDTAHSAVISAAGKDPKGQAAANATIRARLEVVSSTRTRVLMDTDLDISGRMAQFGRGAIADVSNRLIGQFAANISAVIGGTGSAPTAPTAPTAPIAPTPAAEGTSRPGSSSRPVEPGVSGGGSMGGSADAGMDLVGLVVPMVKERYGQAIIGGLAGFALSWLVFGRKAGRVTAAQPPSYPYWMPPTPWEPRP